TRDLLILGNIMRTYSDEPPSDRSVEDLLREYENLPSTDTVGRAALVNSAAVLAHRVGSLSKALDVSQRAVGAMRCIGSVIGVNYCMLHLGLVQLHCGQRREAESTLREAASLAEENFGADSGLKALAEVHLALALHARGEIAEVVELLGRSLPQVEVVDGWAGIYAEAYEVAVLNALARGDGTAAAQWLERMAATASRRGLATLTECATALRVRTTIVQLQLSQELRDESSSARRTMSTAEQSLKWQRGAWRAAPHKWRSHHIGGLALVQGAIARGETAEALNLLDDLDESAQAGARLRHLRALAALRAVAQLQAGEAEMSISSLMPHLNACVQEDDTQLLRDLGPVLLPLLQNALNWSR